MSVHRVHVFVSHSWAHSKHYERIHGWLFSKPHRFGQARVEFKDYSVPKDDPIHDARNARALEAAIFRKISRCHVVVIPTAMYTAYSDWIKKEIAGSGKYSKPLLAVNPRGQKRKSSVVLDAADMTVGWTKKSVVSGVWKLYYAKRSGDKRKRRRRGHRAARTNGTIATA